VVDLNIQTGGVRMTGDNMRQVERPITDQAHHPPQTGVDSGWSSHQKALAMRKRLVADHRRGAAHLEKGGCGFSLLVGPFLPALLFFLTSRKLQADSS